MKFSEAKPGRVFVLRLEDGDILHECIESFAREHGILAASAIVLGGADEGSRIVVGPEQSRARPVVAMEHTLQGVHEVAGVGTLFPDSRGRPALHMHIAGGRNGSAVAGCVRSGVRAWHVLEVVLWEITDTTASRQLDQATGLELLEP